MTMIKYLKSILTKLRSLKRSKELKSKSEIIPKNRIVNDLKEMGIKIGDVLFLHSSLKSIGYVHGGPDAVVEAILEVIGPEGTLIVPSYSMKGNMLNTCLDPNFVFDVRNDTRGLGAIPNSVLKLENVETSIHPTHCTSAIGKKAKFITESHHIAESTFGKGSPWERFISLDGKLLGLGVSMGPITFYHALEDSELNNFPVKARMSETYFVKCIDWNGEIIKVPINPLNQECAKFRIDKEIREDLRAYFWKEFTNKNIIKVGPIGAATSWITSSKMFYDHLKYLMNEGITIYSTEEEIKQRPL